MRFVYLTSQKYPSRKVDPFYWKSMAESFQKILGENFTFVVRDSNIEGLNTVSVPAPKRFRRLYYRIFFPYFVAKYKWNTKETYIFASDSYLLTTLVFWKPVYKYRLVSDWHQLFEDWRDKCIAENSDYLITTSKKLKKLLARKLNAPEDKILVAYGGVDVEKFRQDIKVDLPKGKLLVGYIGGFKSVGLEKGLSTMVESLKHLQDDVLMVFVGGYKTEVEDYKKLAENLGVLNKCLFIEKQSFEMVVAYEKAMDVLVIPYPDHPHFRDYGFPLKVWEYMASGRPIIYSNLEIIAEVLEGQGVPFIPDDAGSLRDAILSVQKMKPSTNYKIYTWRDRAETIINFIK